MRPYCRLARNLASRGLPCSRRLFSAEAAAHPSSKTQIYVSRSRDPLLNLSVEHHLLQTTPPDSTVLLLYTNAPCVVFGRNQNPWLEINLARLAQIRRDPEAAGWSDAPVQLVRRRSGGGAVFHDLGNVNFSVICPPAAFDRDKHAEMVVRALKSLGRDRARVNERHDIVIDVPAEAGTSTFKISGSAYKLTRLRSLHHGTCLLRSPNLSSISGLLRSPGEPFIKARGVESVRSPVRNVGVDNADFEAAVLDQFQQMYGKPDVKEEFNEEALRVEKVRSGYEELQSREWLWGQTPHFTFSTYPTSEDPRARPSLPFDAKFEFQARHGVIEKLSFQSSRLPGGELDSSALVKQRLYDFDDWTAQLARAGVDEHDIGAWINGVMGTEFTRPE